MSNITEEEGNSARKWTSGHGQVDILLIFNVPKGAAGESGTRKAERGRIK